jgi:ubiquinone/menaquinone biosynthesis C-methylase UbiE
LEVRRQKPEARSQKGIDGLREVSTVKTTEKVLKYSCFKIFDPRIQPCYRIASVPIEIDPAGVEPRAILQTVDFRNRRVLEVGAGDGRLTFRYAKDARFVVGIDTKEPDIRSTAMGLRGHVQFLCASATALPFAAEEFEVVFLASSL